MRGPQRVAREDVEEQHRAEQDDGAGERGRPRSARRAATSGARTSGKARAEPEVGARGIGVQQRVVVAVTYVPCVRRSRELEVSRLVVGVRGEERERGEVETASSGTSRASSRALTPA